MLAAAHCLHDTQERPIGITEDMGGRKARRIIQACRRLAIHILMVYTTLATGGSIALLTHMARTVAVQPLEKMQKGSPEFAGFVDTLARYGSFRRTITKLSNQGSNQGQPSYIVDASWATCIRECGLDIAPGCDGDDFHMTDGSIDCRALLMTTVRPNPIHPATKVEAKKRFILRSRQQDFEKIWFYDVLWVLWMFASFWNIMYTF